MRRSIIRRFLTYTNPQLAVIGAWNHGGAQHASPYAPRRNNLRDHWGEYLRFFDAYLADRPTGSAREAEARTLTYFTIGEERWKSTQTWPPAGVQLQPWYLHAGGTLATTPPSDTQGADAYRVDFGASTGRMNRWYTQANGGRVEYGDRAAADRRLLTYTSPSLPHDLELTGHPVVHLWITSTAVDAALIVYLEEVDPRGRVMYLTEGVLRAIHRQIANDPSYPQCTPCHPFTRAAIRPLIPGEPAELRFRLLPLSALVRRGSRVRIAIAGADGELFPRIPDEGEPMIRVLRGSAMPSNIELPWLPGQDIGSEARLSQRHGERR